MGKRKENVKFPGRNCNPLDGNNDFILGPESQDRRRLWSDARADPRLMSGTITNSRTATSESAT